MTINKKIMTMLILVMAIGAISMTAYASTSFIGDDCSKYEQDRMNGKICNDIQQLHDLILEERKMPYVKSMTFTFTNTGTQMNTVICDDNDVILSGGYSFDKTADISMYKNAPNSNSWEINYMNYVLDGPQFVDVYAVCLEVP